MQLRARTGGRRSLLGLLLGAIVASLVFVGAPAPGAGAAQSQGEIERRYTEAQVAAQDAVNRLQAATARHEALLDQIAETEQRISESRTQAAALRVIAKRRAVAAYKDRQTVGDDVTSAVLAGGAVMASLRRTTLLQRANAKDDAAIQQLRSLEQDLAVQRQHLEQQKVDDQKALDTIKTEKAMVDTALADAKRAYDELKARLAAEAAARAAAAAAAAAAARRPPVVSGSPVAGFFCPVRGSFTNDFGDPRSGGRAHLGIDIFASQGTPAVAAKSGYVSFTWDSSGGGNIAYLHANDGNTYFYAHFVSFAGPARSVSQGETIGFVGQTGNAVGPHLHFEIRTPNGAVNPYPSLVAAC